MGRRKKYYTEEQVREANKAKSAKYYRMNKEVIDGRNLRKYYERKRANIIISDAIISSNSSSSLGSSSSSSSNISGSDNNNNNREPLTNGSGSGIEEVDNMGGVVIV